MQVEGFALVVPVADECVDCLTVQAHLRTGKIEPIEIINVRLDIASKISYNYHTLVLSAAQRRQVQADPLGRAIPCSR